MSDLAEANGKAKPITSAAVRDYAHIVLDLMWAAGLARRWLFASAEPGDPATHRQTNFGINVASSEDSRCDDYVIDKLQQAQIRYVRLTWAASAAKSFTERFLDRLLDANFDVMVALIGFRKLFWNFYSINYSHPGWYALQGAKRRSINL